MKKNQKKESEEIIEKVKIEKKGVILLTLNLDSLEKLELVNHAQNFFEKGRILTFFENKGHFKTLDVMVDDMGKTLKIFLN